MFYLNVKEAMATAVTESHGVVDKSLCGPLPIGHTAVKLHSDGENELLISAWEGLTLVQMQYTPNDQVNGYLLWEKGNPLHWSHREF